MKVKFEVHKLAFAAKMVWKVTRAFSLASSAWKRHYSGLADGLGFRWL